MNRQRLFVLAVIGLLAVLLTWGMETQRFRRGRLALMGIATVAALLLLSRRVSLFELLLVLILPAAIYLVVAARKRGAPGR